MNRNVLRRVGGATCGLLLLGLAACESPRPAAPAAAPVAMAEAGTLVRQALAPTGTLRIAAYAGSPTSLVRPPGSDEARGMSVDIGREMAKRLGTPARIVEFERVEQVIDSLRKGEADMTITNASAARAALVDFTEPLVALELGYLVMADSRCALSPTSIAPASGWVSARAAARRRRSAGSTRTRKSCPRRRCGPARRC